MWPMHWDFRSHLHLYIQLLAPNLAHLVSLLSASWGKLEFVLRTTFSSFSLVAQSCPTLADPMDCSATGM